MNYYVNSGIFEDLCAFRNILTIINDYDVKDREYKDEIESLKAQILELQQRPCNGNGKSVMTPIDLNTHCQIKSEYLLYMERYGVPEDGIFLPSLLEELINECCDCDDENEDTHSDPKKSLLLPDTDIFGFGLTKDYNQIIDFSDITEITL